MVRDAKIRVSLDTRKAEADLVDLGKQGEASAARMNSRSKSGSASSSRAFKKGALAGAGFGLGKRIASSVGFMGSIGDVLGESLSGVKADFDKWTTAPKSRAERGAREETAQNTALMAYHSGNTTASKEYYNQVLNTKHLPQQIGSQNIMQALGGGRAASVNGMGPLDDLINKIIAPIREGFLGINSLLGG